LPYDIPDQEPSPANWKAVAEAVRRFARRRGGGAHLAEDIAQETLLRLVDYGRRSQIDSVYALAFRIAENLMLEHHRRARREAATELTPELACAAPSPERVVEGREAVRALTDALARMPKLRREVIVRRRVMHQSCEAIAHDLNLSVKAVEKHVTRGLADLKNAAEAAQSRRRRRA